MLDYSFGFAPWDGQPLYPAWLLSGFTRNDFLRKVSPITVESLACLPDAGHLFVYSWFPIPLCSPKFRYSWLSWPVLRIDLMTRDNDEAYPSPHLDSKKCRGILCWMRDQLLQKSELQYKEPLLTPPSLNSFIGIVFLFFLTKERKSLFIFICRFLFSPKIQISSREILSQRKASFALNSMMACMPSSGGPFWEFLSICFTLPSTFFQILVQPFFRVRILLNHSIGVPTTWQASPSSIVSAQMLLIWF